MPTIKCGEDRSPCALNVLLEELSQDEQPDVVCPVCQNVLHAMGDAAISCCGITLPPLEAEETDADHAVNVEKVEDEHFVTVTHDMTKEHYISFLAYVTFDRMQLIKLYPEQSAETRFNFRGKGFLYLYCNKHGLMKKRV